MANKGPQAWMGLHPTLLDSPVIPVAFVNIKPLSHETNPPPQHTYTLVVARLVG